jgi:hypothetical protein
MTRKTPTPVQIQKLRIRISELAKDWKEEWSMLEMLGLL